MTKRHRNQCKAGWTLAVVIALQRMSNQTCSSRLNRTYLHYQST